MEERVLRIFSAGVAAGLVKALAKRWEEEHPDVSVEVSMGGSVDLIRRIINGESCDVMISADDTNIRDMLIPDHTDECITWAGNAMVLASVNGEDIEGADWQKLLLRKDAVFTHMDPKGDPAGYRAVMTLKLADHIQDGLARVLLNHPGYIGKYAKPGKPDFSKAQYAIVYESMAKARKMSYVKLPPVMDLSDDVYAEEYSREHLVLRDSVVVSGSPIRHGLAVLSNTKEPELAKLFVEDFLKSDFEKAGFKVL